MTTQFDISALGLTVTEGGVYSFTLTPKAALGSDTVIRWEIVPKGELPISSSDFSALSGVVNFASGDTDAQTVTLTPSDDSVLEVLKHFELRVYEVVGARDDTSSETDDILIGSQDVTLSDDETDDYGGSLLVSTTEANILTAGNTQDLNLIGAGGDDNYVITRFQHGDIDISDALGANLIKFDAGVTITGYSESSSLVFGFLTVIESVSLTLSTGAVVRITSPAGKFSYQLGDGEALSYADFKTAIGASGTNETSALATDYTITTATAVPDISGNTGSVPTETLVTTIHSDVIGMGGDVDFSAIGAGGDDVYVITRFQHGDIDISDALGANLIKFDVGVSITGYSESSSLVFGFLTVIESVSLTLSTGAVVSITSPGGKFSYQLGDGETLDYDAFKTAIGASGTNADSALAADYTVTAPQVPTEEPEANNAPTVATEIPDQTATEDTAFSLDISSVFADADGDTLTYSISGNPSWLTLTGTTLSGTPLQEHVGTHTITVTASDGNGGTVTETFTLTVENTDDAPVFEGEKAQTVTIGGIKFTYLGDTADFSIRFQYETNTDAHEISIESGNLLKITTSQRLHLNLQQIVDLVNGDTAAVVATGYANYADTRTEAEKLLVRAELVDPSTGSNGLNYDAFFGTQWAQGAGLTHGMSPGSEIHTAITWDENADANGVVFTAQATDEDNIPGQTATDIITYELVSGAGDNSFFSIDSATGAVRFLASPDYEAQANYIVHIKATSTNASSGNTTETTAQYRVNLNNLNDAPALAEALADQTAAEDRDFNFDVSAAFSDPDGDTLTYTATLADGSALPDWLSFDENTGIFSGRPAQSDAGTLSVRVTATDPSGEAVTDTFDIVVENTDNNAPVFEATGTENTITVAGIKFTYSGDSPSFYVEADQDIDTTYIGILYREDQNSLYLTVSRTNFTLQTIVDMVNGNLTHTDFSGFRSDQYGDDRNNEQKALVTAELVDPTTGDDALDYDAFFGGTGSTKYHYLSTPVTWNENSDAANVVFTVSATDADNIAGQPATDTITYELIDGHGDNAFFTIDETTGAVRFAATPDYETQSSYEVRIKAVSTSTLGDGSTKETTIQYRVDLTDTNDAPEFATAPLEATVNVNGIIIRAKDINETLDIHFIPTATEEEPGVFLDSTNNRLNVKAGSEVGTLNALLDLMNGDTDFTDKFEALLANGTDGTTSINTSDAAWNTRTFSLTVIDGAATPIPVQAAEEVVLTEAMLGLSDVDSQDGSGNVIGTMTLTVSNVENGKFQLSGADATQFTLADVRAGNVKFVHDGSPHTDGARFTMVANDGQTNSAAVIFTFTVAHANRAPTLDINPTGRTQDLAVSEHADGLADQNAFGIITFADVDDDDTGTNLQFFIGTDADTQTNALPHNGASQTIQGVVESTDAPALEGVDLGDFVFTRTVDGEVSWSFTLEESLARSLGSGQTATVSAWVRVSDGGLDAVEKLSVTVSGNNDAPTQTNNTGASFGGTGVVLSSTLLQWSDVDANDVPSQITYTLTGVPASGKMQISADGTTWYDMSVNETFTQADINNGYIRYVPDASTPADTSFKYTVTDGKADASAEKTFTLTFDNVAPTVDIAPSGIDQDTQITESGIGEITTTGFTVHGIEFTLKEGQTAVDFAFVQESTPNGPELRFANGRNELVFNKDLSRQEIVATVSTSPDSRYVTFLPHDVNLTEAISQADLVATGTITPTTTTKTGRIGDALASGFITFADADANDTGETLKFFVGTSAGSQATELAHGDVYVFVQGVVESSDVTALNGANLGSFILHRTGAGQVTWEFELNNENADVLTAGQTATVSIWVRVSDGYADSEVKKLTVTVTGTNDAPTITSTDVAITVTEDDVVATPHRLNFDDPDGANADVTFRAKIAHGTTAAEASAQVDSAAEIGSTDLAFIQDGALNYIDIVGTYGTFGLDRADSTGVLTWRYTPGAGAQVLKAGETVYESIGIYGTDGTADGEIIVITVTITGVNDAPTVTGPTSVDYTENTTGVVATINVNDPDGDALTYSFSGEHHLFDFDETTGELRFKNPPDYEAYTNGRVTFGLRAEDTSGASTTYSLTINLQDVEEAPTLVKVQEINLNDLIILTEKEVGSSVTKVEFLETPAGASDTVTYLGGDTINVHIGSSINTAQKLIDFFLADRDITERYDIALADGVSGDAVVNIADAKWGGEFFTETDSDTDAEIAARTIQEDESFIYTVAKFFTDSDGDTLSYTATLADGTALPSWLTLNAVTGYFSGTPLQADVGTLDITVTATDPSGLSVSDTFTLTIKDVNDAPVITPIDTTTSSVNINGLILTAKFPTNAPDIEFRFSANNPSTGREGNKVLIYGDASINTLQKMHDLLIGAQGIQEHYTITFASGVDGTTAIDPSDTSKWAGNTFSPVYPDDHVLSTPETTTSQVSVTVRQVSINGVIFRAKDTSDTTSLNFNAASSPGDTNVSYLSHANRLVIEANSDDITTLQKLIDWLKTYTVFTSRFDVFLADGVAGSTAVAMGGSAWQGLIFTTSTLETTEMREVETPVKATAPLLSAEGDPVREVNINGIIFRAKDDSDETDIFFSRHVPGSGVESAYHASGILTIHADPSDVNTLQKLINFVNGYTDVTSRFDVSLADGVDGDTAIDLTDSSWNRQTFNTALKTSIVPVPITEGGTITITEEMLGITDEDPDDNPGGVLDGTMLISVHETQNGAFYINGIRIDLFTVQQVRDGLVTFVHDGGERHEVENGLKSTTLRPTFFKISVSDGRATSDPVTFELDVTPVDDPITLADAYEVNINGLVIRHKLGMSAEILFQGVNTEPYIDRGFGVSIVEGININTRSASPEFSTLNNFIKWLNNNSDFNEYYEASLGDGADGEAAIDVSDGTWSGRHQLTKVANDFNVPDQTALEDAAFTLDISGYFTDPDAFAITYTATLKNGDALPDWLSFNSATGVFTGTPTQADVKRLAIKLTATSSDGTSIIENFAIDVQNVDDNAPVITGASETTKHSFIVSGVEFTYIGEPPAGFFVSVLQASSSTYTISETTKNGNSGLFINVDYLTRQQIVDMINQDITAIGSYTISDSRTSPLITASLVGDDGDADFNISTDPTNVFGGSKDYSLTDFTYTAVSPEITISETTAPSTAVFTAQATDADNLAGQTPTDIITYELVAGAGDNSYFRIDAETGAVHFIDPPDFDTQARYEVHVKAISTSSLGAGSVQEATAIYIVNLTDAAVDNQTVQEDTAFSFTVPADAFDSDNPIESYTATLADGTALPKWLKFDTDTATFFGTPPQSAVGDLKIAVSGATASGATVLEEFILSVENIDDNAPVFDSIGLRPAYEITIQGIKFTYTAEDAPDDFSLFFSYTKTSVEHYIDFRSSPSEFYYIGTSHDGLTLQDIVDLVNDNPAAASFGGYQDRLTDEEKSYIRAELVDSNSGSTALDYAIWFGSTQVGSRKHHYMELGTGPDVVPAYETDLDENTDASEIVFTASATDADNIDGQTPTDTIHYELVSGAGDNAYFTIDAATGAVRFAATPNYETKASYAVHVKAISTSTLGDGSTQETTNQYTVNLNDVNDAPEIRPYVPTTQTIDLNGLITLTAKTNNPPDVLFHVAPSNHDVLLDSFATGGPALTVRPGSNEVTTVGDFFGYLQAESFVTDNYDIAIADGVLATTEIDLSDRTKWHTQQFSPVDTGYHPLHEPTDGARKVNINGIIFEAIDEFETADIFFTYIPSGRTARVTYSSNFNNIQVRGDIHTHNTLQKLVDFINTQSDATSRFKIYLADGVDGATVIDLQDTDVWELRLFSLPAGSEPVDALGEGEALTITETMLALSDVDAGDQDANGNLLGTMILKVSNVKNGVFQLSGVDVTQFTLADVRAGNVKFVHDGSDSTADDAEQTRFTLVANDGDVDSAPITFAVDIFPPRKIAIHGLVFTTTSKDVVDIEIGTSGSTTDVSYDSDTGRLTINFYKQSTTGLGATLDNIVIFLSRDNIFTADFIAQGFTVAVADGVDGDTQWNFGDDDADDDTIEVTKGEVYAIAPAGNRAPYLNSRLSGYTQDFNVREEGTDVGARDTSATGFISFFDPDGDAGESLKIYIGQSADNQDTLVTDNSIVRIKAHITVSDVPSLVGVELDNIIFVQTDNVLSWTFNMVGSPGKIVDVLGDGQTAQIDFWVRVSDGYADSAVEKYTITIQGSNDAPTEAANTGTIYEDKDTPIILTTEMLQWTDVDDNDGPSEVEYRLTELNSGKLEFNHATLGWITLRAGQRISQEDIDAGNVRYVPNATTPATAIFKFTVTDGDYTSGEQSFRFRFYDPDANDAPEEVHNNGASYTSDMENFVLTTAMLQWDDFDTDDGAGEITYTLTGVPSSGKMQISADGTTWYDMSVNETFTQADIDNGNIRYVADTTTPASASFTFTVSDGEATASAAQTFTITLENTAPTEKTNNGATYMATDANIVLTKAMLEWTDIDAGDTTGEIIYRLVSVPSSGKLELNSVNLGGWHGLSAGNNFTQADIDNGNVRYVADSSTPASASFTFTVDDGESARSPVQTFEITLTTANTPTVSTRIPDQTVNEDAGWEISLGSYFSDPDGDSLTYTITLADGSPAPSWIFYSSDVKTIGGIPRAADIGTISLRVTASDGTESISDVFKLTVNNIDNNVPIFSQIEGVEESITIQGIKFIYGEGHNDFSLRLNYASSVKHVIDYGDGGRMDVTTSHTGLTRQDIVDLVNGNTAAAAFAGYLDGRSDEEKGWLRAELVDPTTGGTAIDYADFFGGTVAPFHKTYALRIPYSWDENRPASDVVLTVQATDADNIAGETPTETITYSLTSAGSWHDNDYFTIDETTGEVRFAQTPDFETKSSYIVSIRATSTSTLGEGSVRTNHRAYEITINDTNDAPEEAHNIGGSYGKSASSLVLTKTMLEWTDIDANHGAGDVTYRMTQGPDSGKLQLNQNGAWVDLSTPANANRREQTLEDFTGYEDAYANGTDASDGLFHFKGTFTLSGNTWSASDVTVYNEATGETHYRATDSGVTTLTAGTTQLVFYLNSSGVWDISPVPPSVPPQVFTKYFVLATVNAAGDGWDFGGTSRTATDIIFNSFSSTSLPTSFTQTDIENGNVRYVPDGTERASTNFKFTVDDGESERSAEQTFEITYTPPTREVTIHGMLFKTTNEDIESITFGVSLTSGVISRYSTTTKVLEIGGPSTGQKLEDIIKFLNATDNRAGDSISFTVELAEGADGTHTFNRGADDNDPTTIEYTFGESFTVPDFVDTNTAPTQTSNTGATYNSGDANLVLTTAMLQWTDADDDDGAAEVTYTLTAVPASGKMQISADGTTWYDMSVNETFTQADIDAGRIRYAPDSSTPAAASFSFTVSDGEADASAVQTFAIAINQPPTETANTGANYTDDADSVVITTALLQWEDSDGTSSEITYTLTAAPVSGKMQISGDGTQWYDMSVNETFTQADIDNGYVRYVPDSTTPADATFKFTVSDGDYTSAEQTFALTVEEAVTDEHAPVFENVETTHSVTIQGIKFTFTGDTYPAAGFYIAIAETSQFYLSHTTHEGQTGLSIWLPDSTETATRQQVIDLVNEVLTSSDLIGSHTIHQNRPAGVRYITASLAETGTGDQSFTSDGTLVRHQLVSSAPTISWDENTDASEIVFTATATDADNIAGQTPTETITYELVSGMGDNSYFTIDAATGAVRFAASPDYETKASYEVHVKAISTSTLGDGSTKETTQQYTVNLNDIDETEAEDTREVNVHGLLFKTTNEDAVDVRLSTASETPTYASYDSGTGRLTIFINAPKNLAEYVTILNGLSALSDNGWSVEVAADSNGTDSFNFNSGSVHTLPAVPEAPNTAPTLELAPSGHTHDTDVTESGAGETVTTITHHGIIFTLKEGKTALNISVSHTSDTGLSVDGGNNKLFFDLSPTRQAIVDIFNTDSDSHYTAALADGVDGSQTINRGNWYNGLVLTPTTTTTGGVGDTSASGVMVIGDADTGDATADLELFVGTSAGSQTSAVANGGTATIQGVVESSDVSSLNGANLGSFTIGRDGSDASQVSWSFALDDDAAASLGEGQTATASIWVRVYDGEDSSEVKKLSVTITGAHDAPSVTQTAVTIEVARGATLKLTDLADDIGWSDPDADDSLFSYFKIDFGGSAITGGGFYLDGTQQNTAELEALTSGDVEFRAGNKNGAPFTFTLQVGDGGESGTDATDLLDAITVTIDVL